MDALRTGCFPVALWLRQTPPGADPSAIGTLLQGLWDSGSLADLPQRVFGTRQQATDSSQPAGTQFLGRHVTLLFTDPDRWLPEILYTPSR